jgi:hypothetical protein
LLLRDPDRVDLRKIAKYKASATSVLLHLHEPGKLPSVERGIIYTIRAGTTLVVFVNILTFTTGATRVFASLSHSPGVAMPF